MKKQNQNKKSFLAKKTEFFLIIALTACNSFAFAGGTCIQNNYLGMNVDYDFANYDFSPDSSMLFSVGTSSSYTPANAGLTYAYGGECLFSATENDWFTSFVIINIDGEAYDAQDNWPMVGNISNTGSEIYGTKTIDSYIDLKMDYKFVNNPSTGINADTAEFEFTATNIDASNSHTVSLMLMFDTEVNGNDGAILSTNDGFTTITNSEIFYKSSPMPADWWDYDVDPKTGTPNLVGRGHLYNNPYDDPASEPDIFMIGSWSAMTNQLFTTSSPWSLTQSGSAIGDDSAVQLWWTNGSGGGVNSSYTLPPGQSLTWVAYYGLNQGVLLATPTVSATYTPSPTHLTTPTYTYTPTLTASPTNTITNTDTFTSTMTETCTETPTYTASLTNTITGTDTFTLTMTEICTETPTYTASPTNTITNTDTLTPTITITPTNTITTTQTFTTSITCTTTITPTPTATLCLKLYQNSPSPFSNGTNIIYQLCNEADVKVKIYTISGEVVVELTQQGQPGMNSIYWDAKNKTGRGVASGTYIYSIETMDGQGKKKVWGKMAVVK